MKEMLQREVERHFRPEFMGRLDELIVFKHLTRKDLMVVVDYELRKVRERLIEHGLELELTDQAKELLLEKGYSRDFGARPLRRAIEQHIEDPLSEDILRGAYKDKNKVIVSAKGDADAKKHLFFEGVKEKAPGPVPAEVGEST